MSSILHIGLIVNPLAGLGGALALKGSDGQVMRKRLSELSPEQRQRSAQRTHRAIQPLVNTLADITFSTWGGDMGESLLAQLELPHQVLGSAGALLADASDTQRAAQAMVEAGVDIIVFAGGDGTARDLFDVLGETTPVLGIPAGVKMHSSVFAVSPEAAGELLQQLAEGGLVGLSLQEVRDIDEEAFRHDVVRSRFYGDMLVPGEGRYLQHTKVGGRESEELVAAEIGSWMVQAMEKGVTYLIGPGSTTAAVMQEQGLPNTLLGVDVIRDGELLASDADESMLFGCLQSCDRAHIVVTAIGGQGHVFGRGNQQFSPAVIRKVGLQNITVIATKSKISALEGRALLVDTNDAELDSLLAGYYQVITGYDDYILYRVGSVL